MNPEVLLSCLTIIVLGLLVSKWLLRRAQGNSKDLALNLGLLSGTGVLMAMGSIEMAGRYGYSIILALVAFSLVFVISPLIFSPIRRLNGVIRFATSIDFLTFRFRGRTVAMVACISLTIATVPLILAQITAIESVAAYLFGNQPKLLILLFVAGLLLSLSLFSVQLDSENNLGWIMTTAGLLLLPALGLSAWTSIEAAFGGLTEMNNWVSDSGQRSIVQRMDSSYSLFIVFLAASFASPINFGLLVADNISERQTDMTSWAYPLLVLLACIPVFPLLWSGISLQSLSPLQEYLFNLPLVNNQTLVSGLGAACIIMLAISFACSLILISSKILINSCLLPTKDLHQQSKLTIWLKHRQLLIAAGMVIFCLALSLTIKGRSITDYYLAGFAGLAQLTPGMLAATYLPGVNRRGFVAGLIGGMLLWLITIALPLLFGDWTWQLPMSDKTIQIGMQNWNIWAIEALLVNVVLCTVLLVCAWLTMSIFLRASRLRKNQWMKLPPIYAYLWAMLPITKCYKHLQPSD